MKTLKKTLCLVLAVVMAVGVLVIPANAATSFPDDADIEHDEAVAVLNGLGILKGDDKGNFNPEEILTRAHAAKIIAYLMLGEDGAEDYVASSEPFTDMSGDDVKWAVNYVAYCADNDIVGGNGDGTFKPKGELTGAAFAKMLLCALGYDGEIEGFGTSDWAKNVESIARNVGLNSGITSFQYSAALSRDKAAQMAYNALKVGRVTAYKGGTEITLPGGVSITQGAERTVDKDDTLWNEFKLDKRDGTKDKEMVGDNGGKDDFGRPSKYQIVVGSNQKVLYSKAISPVKVYTAAATKVATDLKDYKFDSDNAPTVTVSGLTTSTAVITDYDGIQNLTGNGRTVEVYATNKVIDNIVVIQPVVAKLTKTSSKVTLAINAANGTVSGSVDVTDNEDKDDDWFDILSEYENKTYVLAVIKNGTTKTILSVEPITTVTGKLTGTGTAVVGSTHSKSYTIDGTKYNLAAGAKTTWTMKNGEPKLSSTDDVIALVDSDNNIYDFIEAEAAKTAVTSMYVVAAYDSAGEWGPIKMLQAVLPDGEVITGIVSDKSMSLDNKAGGYTYTIDPDTGDYVIKSSDAAGTYSGSGSVSAAGIYKLNNDITVKTSSTRLGGLYFANDVKFITVEGAKGTLDVSVKDGRQNVTVKANDYIVVTEDANGNKLVSAVYITDDDQYTAPSVKGEDLLYFNSNNTITGNGLGEDGKTEVTYYEAYLNGEKTSVTLYTDTGKNGTIAAGEWYSYTVNENTGVYALTQAKSSVVATKTAVELALVNGVYYMSWAAEGEKGDYNNVAMSDLDATDAIVVDLTDGSDNVEVTNIDELLTLIESNTGVEVTLTYNSTAKTVDLIYVVNHGSAVE